MYGYVYMTTNTINGKKYIGRRKSDKFLGDKYLGSGNHIRNAIRKYGAENFKVTMIESYDNLYDLIEGEKYWIKKYDAVNSDEFYNHSPGGENEGFVRGEGNIINLSDNKKRMIEKRRGHKVSEETKAKLRSYNASLPPEIKKSIQEKRLATLRSDEQKYNSYRRKISDSLRNRPYSESAYKKVSEEHKGKKMMNNGIEQHWVPPEEIDNMISLGYVIGGLPRNTDRRGSNNPMYGVKGEENPNYGRVSVVNSEGTRRKVRKEEVQEYIRKGWKLGWYWDSGSTTIESISSEKSTTE